MKKGKTECMLFGTQRKIAQKQLDIKYRNSSISYTTSYTYLGVKLDQCLNLSKHVNETLQKATGRLNLLQRLRPQLTTISALVIYQSLLISIFTYCSIVTMHTSNTHKQKIESLENRAKKIIFNGRRNCQEIGSINHLMRRKLCEQVYKCIHGDVCTYILLTLFTPFYTFSLFLSLVFFYQFE